MKHKEDILEVLYIQYLYVMAGVNLYFDKINNGNLHTEKTR